MADLGCETDCEDKIRLVSGDGEMFTVATEVAKLSNTVKNMLDDLGFDGGDGDDSEPIPLTRVHSDVLTKIITWMQHHSAATSANLHNDQHASESARRVLGGNAGTGTASQSAGLLASDCCHLDPWDQEFMNTDQGTLLEIMLAANYLDIQPLIETCCRAVALMIRGKDSQEIRKTFGISSPAESAMGDPLSQNISSNAVNAFFSASASTRPLTAVPSDTQDVVR